MHPPTARGPRPSPDGTTPGAPPIPHSRSAVQGRAGRRRRPACSILPSQSFRPARRPCRRPAMLLETALSAETSAPPAPHLPTLLIVGEPGGLNVAREALVELKLGWEVIFAASATEAHAIPAVRNVDVILVDLGNPYLEGVELVSALHAKLPHTPIVLMSTFRTAGMAW